MLRLGVLTSLLTLTASALVFVSCSSSTPTEPGLVAARAEAAVARADSAEVQAFLANDPTTLSRLWSDDFVVRNPFNQFVTKPQVVNLVTSGILAFSAYERHIEYTKAYGDLVVIAGSETVVWAGKMPLAGQTTQLKYTAVWARQGNEWREIARHANIVPPGGPAGPRLGP